MVEAESIIRRVRGMREELKPVYQYIEGIRESFSLSKLEVHVAEVSDGDAGICMGADT